MIVFVPNKPATPHRTIRCDPVLWDAAKAKAEREDPSATISDVIRRLLEQYVREDNK
jgi:hypothetical protein